MRKKNAVADFADHRADVLLENFRKSLSVQSRISATKAFRMAVDAPSPRFWVSEVRALVIVRKMIAGEDVTSGMNPEKREMYLEIFGRVRAALKANPHLSLADAVFDIVNNPAPRSYLSVERAKKIIYGNRIKKRQAR